MRHTFMLLVEFGGDLRGKEKRFISTQIKEIATKQAMHAFSYQEDDSGQYAFFARPDLVDERKDQYEVGALREVLRIWLADHPDIVNFELGAIANLDMITPKVSDVSLQDINKAKSTIGAVIEKSVL